MAKYGGVRLAEGAKRLESKLTLIIALPSCNLHVLKDSCVEIRRKAVHITRKQQISSLFRSVFCLRTLAVGQTDGVGEQSGGAKAVCGPKGGSLARFAYVKHRFARELRSGYTAPEYTPKYAILWLCAGACTALLSLGCIVAPRTPRTPMPKTTR